MTAAAWLFAARAAGQTPEDVPPDHAGGRPAGARPAAEQPSGGQPAGDQGELDGKQYEARRCPLRPGVHRLSGTDPYQVMAYGYASADAYAFPGGANIKKIYEPPPVF